MSLLVEREESTSAEQKPSIEIRPSRRIIFAKPGSRAHLVLSLDSPHKLELRLAVEGLTPDVARYSIVPVKGKTPFTARLDLVVNPGAMGIHPFKVIAQDVHGRGYGAENLVLIILPPELPMEVVNYLRTLVAFYKAYGIQYVIWYLLKHLYNDKGMSFTEIKAVYELLRGKRLSNGTIGDLVERMEKKGIVVKRRARYYAGIEDEKLVLEVIDSKRVRAGRRGAKQLLEASSEGLSTERSLVGGEAIPLAVRRILRIAQRLIEQGRRSEALGLLQHSLIGVRKTGKWLLWTKGIFIYKEEKARPPYHYFMSRKISGILKNLGVKEGFIHVKPVDTLIHSLFPQGYREARRIHYLLKSLGWITYGPPLILYITVYPDGTGGFRLESVNREVIASLNYNPRRAVRIVKNMAMPGEHVDEYNDNTYFRYK